MKIDYLQTPALPPSLYEDTVAGCRETYPVLSDTQYADVCVVGGGLAGLHTALGLAAAGRRVVLLEARRVGWGASGRNGGHVIPEFACGMGKLESLLGDADARAVWRLVREGADLLRARIREGQIDCEYQPLHIEAALTPRHVGYLREWQQGAKTRYAQEYRFLDAKDMQAMTGSTRYQGGLLDEQGGHLNPLKLTLGLARQLVKAGGLVFENSPVQGWQSHGQGQLAIQAGQGQVIASTLVLAANVGIADVATATAQSLARRILPVGTWLVATEPLDENLAAQILPSRAAVADNRVVLDYYRLTADRRMVFGGGCSYLGEATPGGFAEAIRGEMIKVFPQLSAVPISHAWGGVIDISMTRAPDLGLQTLENGARLAYAQGFSGSGLVATCTAGQALAEALLGREADLRLLARLRPRPFPGGAWLRGPLVAAGMLYHRLRDAW